MKQSNTVRPRLSGSSLRPVLGAIAAGLLAVAAMVPMAAEAAGPLVSFDGGIGSQPLRAGALVNDVNGTPPGGRPWVIASLTAHVDVNGGIKADGRGLILAGGPTIGTGAGQSVRARLYCDGVPSDSTTLVPLATNGDFRINDTLVPTPPAVCNTPVLLIINANGAWFAAGIPN